MFGDRGQRDVAIARLLKKSLHRGRIADVDFVNELQLDVLLQLSNQFGQVFDMPRNPWLHQRFDRGHEQMDDRLFTATKACAVAAGK